MVPLTSHSMNCVNAFINSIINAAGLFLKACVPEWTKALADCRALVQSKYLQYCSPTIPFHKVVLMISRIILEKQALLAQYPLFHYRHRSAPISSQLRDELVQKSCKILEMSEEVVKDLSTTAWTWMLQTYVHWHPVVFLLTELCRTPLHPQTARAWRATTANSRSPMV
jgi:hypothetical protein